MAYTSVVGRVTTRIVSTLAIKNAVTIEVIFVDSIKFVVLLNRRSVALVEQRVVLYRIVVHLSKYVVIVSAVDLVKVS